MLNKIYREYPKKEIMINCRCNFLNVKYSALFSSISEMFDEVTRLNEPEKGVFVMK